VSADTTYYELLGVAPDAPKDEIRSAYQAKLADVREDRTREEETRRPSDDVIRAKRDEEAQLRTAWQILSDPVQRQRYDERVHVDGAGEADSEAAEAGGAAVADEGGGEAVADELVLTPAAPAEPARVHGMDRAVEIPSNGRRMTAAIIDGVTFAAVWSVIALPLVLGVGIDKGAPLSLVLFGTSAFLILAYFIYPIYSSGQTLGKRYTYTMVVDRATGRLPKLGQAINRYLIPAFLLAIGGSLGPVLALFLAMSFLMSRDQISLLDRLARTAVVIARYKPVRSA
jgi:uncharacterized RDD family membrane protein YckC